MNKKNQFCCAATAPGSLLLKGGGNMRRDSCDKNGPQQLAEPERPD